MNPSERSDQTVLLSTVNAIERLVLNHEAPRPSSYVGLVMTEEQGRSW